MTKRSDSILTQKLVREFLRYEPTTGHLFYKPRDQEWFASYRSCCSWNARHAGKRAGKKHPKGYLVVSVNGEEFKAHQLIVLWMTGQWPEDEVDHIDHDGFNNRWKNLHAVSRSINQRNQVLRRNKKYDLPLGVKQQRSGRYEARLSDHGKYICLGTYSTVEEAVAARVAANPQYGFSSTHGSARVGV